MRRIFLWGFLASGGLVVQDRTFSGVDIMAPYESGLIALAAISGIGAVVTSDPVTRRLRRGPRLEAGDISEETRIAHGGEDLQVLRVAIYNSRDGGGEPATARDVVPHLEAFDRGGKRVAHTRGSWGPDAHRKAPSTVTFRPTHEDHPLELAAKFPDEDEAWLAGAVEPQLGRGVYTIRAALRGDGLRKPAVFEWRLLNPGKNGKLRLASTEGDWPSLPPNSSADTPQPPIDQPDSALEPAKAPVDPPVEPPKALEKSPPVGKPFNEVVAGLLMEGRELSDDLLAARRTTSSNPFGMIPAVTEVGARIRNWNERVAEVVDNSALPFSQKMELEIYRDSPFLIGGPSAERLGELLDNNLGVLARLR